MHGYFPVKPFYLGAMALAGAVSFVPSTAEAQTTGQSFTAGLTFSYSIGARPAFGIGGDLRFTNYQLQADQYGYGTTFSAVGAFFQPTYLVGGAGRFAFGAHGGVLTDVFFNIDAEIGLTIRTKSKKGHEPGGHGLHLGFAPIFNLIFVETGPTFRASIALSEGMRSEFIIGGDLRGPGPCIYFSCSGIHVGRPLRAAPNENPTLAPLLVGRRDPARPRTKAKTLARSTRERLLSHWARAASTESASVPAFLAIARDLSLAGAPNTLVTQALRAAEEEATHTALCAELANEWSPVHLTPETPSVPRNADAHLDALLRRLALDSFWDGCLGEGAAAAEARRTQIAAKDVPTREALSVIARDEQGHADLSERIIAFCLSAGGKPVRDALIESVEQGRAREELRLSNHVEEAAEDTEARLFGASDVAAQRLAREEAFESSMQLLSRVL